MVSVVRNCEAGREALVRRLSTSAACDTCKPLSLFAILRAAGAVRHYTIAFINCRRLDTLAIALATLKWPLDRGNSVSDPRCSDRSVAHIISLARAAEMRAAFAQAARRCAKVLSPAD